MSTWRECRGTIYGAKANERGPLGGGAGYKAAVTGGDKSVRSLEDLVDALELARSGDLIFLPGDVEIDLTALVYIEKLVLRLPGGVTLASDRGVEGSPGAILTCDALDAPGLFQPLGPGVRLTGIRLQGPNSKRYLDHHRRSFAEGRGHEYYYRFPVSRGIVCEVDELEIDNCELRGFSHGAILLRKGTGHRIHHNFIHHNQYQGLGYGVTHGTAFSTIECNLFNWNRHSIAATGEAGSGYTARHNLELGESLSHCFDVHGGRDRKDGTQIAATRVLVENNTFMAEQRPVVVRGQPEEEVLVTRNWFPLHPTPENAVEAEDGTRVVDNYFGRDPGQVF